MSSLLRNQELSPIPYIPFKLCFYNVTWRGVFDTTLCDKVCQWLMAGQRFSLGTPVSSTNNSDCHDILVLQLRYMVGVYLKYFFTVRNFDSNIWAVCCLFSSYYSLMGLLKSNLLQVGMGRFMVFNITFDNISVISCRFNWLQK